MTCYHVMQLQNAQWSVGQNKSCSVAQVSLKICKPCFKSMLSTEIISALIMLIKPGLNRLYYFIVGALDGKESSHLKG